MLTFQPEKILQKNEHGEKIWTIAELLEHYNPLSGEPLAGRNEAMRQVADMAERIFNELSESARLRYDFWKFFSPKRVENQELKYEIAHARFYQWQLNVNSEGLFYKDISGQFSQRQETVHEQLFSDFWFYGPLMPLPDLQIRRQVIAAIRNAFMQAGSPASTRHFQLFDYPEQPVEPRQWVAGDHRSNNFILVRDYGIEINEWNSQKGRTNASFLSFEHLLHLPPPSNAILITDIYSEIRQFLEQEIKSQTAKAAWLQTPKSSEPPFDRDEPYRSFTPDKTESKRLFMENDGQTHYIYRDGFGDRYFASPADEDLWRKELLENYEKRIGGEESGVLLAHIARSMKINRATNVENLLLEASKNASPKAKQAIAYALVEVFNNEQAAAALIALLDLEAEAGYWLNYVFNSFFRMRNNRGVHDFLVECLRGSDEIRFNKTRDLLAFWGIHLDEPTLANQALLQKLDWNKAAGKDPETLMAIEKLIRFITR